MKIFVAVRHTNITVCSEWVVITVETWLRIYEIPQFLRLILGDYLHVNFILLDQWTIVILSLISA